MHAFNAHHEDNLFKNPTSSSRKKAKQANGNKASDILNELFDSDSEQNISLMSARTPITAFFKRCDQSKRLEEDEENHLDLTEPKFQERVYIARKANEAKGPAKAKGKKATHKLFKTVQKSPLVIDSKTKKKRMDKDTQAISRFSQEVSSQRAICAAFS